MLTVSTPGDIGDIDEAPRPIAGGQDLLTTMKDYTSRPVRVVNLNASPERAIAGSTTGCEFGHKVKLADHWNQ